MKVLRRHKNKKKQSFGQAALEYALVIGVISVGIIIAGKAVFGQKDGKAHELMGKVVEQASKTMESN